MDVRYPRNEHKSSRPSLSTSVPRRLPSRSAGRTQPGRVRAAILPGSYRAREAAQIAGGQLHPRRGMTAGPEEEIALLMRRWEQVKAGDGAVVLIGGEPGNREIAPRAAAHRVAEARRIVANQSSNGGLTTSD